MDNLLKPNFISLLAKKVNGTENIETELGWLDILTDDYIYQVKEMTKFKQAIGEIISFGGLYPAHKKVIAFYAYHYFPDEAIAKIESICAKNDISIIYLDFRYEIMIRDSKDAPSMQMGFIV